MMKRILSKTLAVALVFVLVFSCVGVSASALTGNCTCEHCPSIVIPGLFQSDVRYLDENGNEMLNKDGEPYSAPFFMEGSADIVKLALEEALIPLASLLIKQEDIENRCAEAIADVLGKALLSNIQLDEFGQPVKNIQADKYETSLAGLTAQQRAFVLGQVPLNSYVQEAGLDHLYFLSYLHSGNLMTAVNDLYELIQTAKRETGHDKVNLVPISQGGSVMNALMQLYIDKGLDISDDVNRVCYVVPAADGANILGDIYLHGIIDDPDALYGYMMPSLLGDDQQLLAYLINLILRLFPGADLDNILDTATDSLVEDYLERSTSLWALVPSEQYPGCREKFLMDEDDAFILEQTDWYYNAQVNAGKYILETKEKGVEFFDIVDYNYVSYKIYDSWNETNGDGIIHTGSESFGATTVAVDTALPADYVQANTYCTDPEHHNHIDEARLVDASTGILCESTFYFKGQNHEATARNDVIMRLAVRILTDSSFKDIYSDPAYPQFNYARHSSKASSLYNAWKNYDTSYLSAEDKAEFEAAKAELKAAMDSTCMPTEDFDAAVARFDKITTKIATGEEPVEEEKNILEKFLEMIIKFFNDIIIKLFGDSGFSEM
ncbi:MAG: hypothetical protein IJO24_06265 [Clostridia bacterium]|nr:hypothetical protein [Clostridia bacterium]